MWLWFSVYRFQYISKDSVFGSTLTNVKISVVLCTRDIPDSKVHGANMWPTWGRQVPGGPHVGPMNLAIRDMNLFAEFICIIPQHDLAIRISKYPLKSSKKFPCKDVGKSSTNML